MSIITILHYFNFNAIKLILLITTKCRKSHKLLDYAIKFINSNSIYNFIRHIGSHIQYKKKQYTAKNKDEKVNNRKHAKTFLFKTVYSVIYLYRI